MNKDDFNPDEINVPPFKAEWITSGIKDDAIDYAEKLGKKLTKKLTSSQIRNFYGEVKRIQLRDFDEQSKTAFLLLHPKLAYASKRAGNDSATLFKDEILKAYKAVNIHAEDGYKRFVNFCNLCEAILAFHKANERKS